MLRNASSFDGKVNGWLSAGEVCSESGASYRQLDCWCRRGLIEPVAVLRSDGKPGGGTGSTRWFDPSQVRLVRVMRVVSQWAGGFGNRPSFMWDLGGDGPWVYERDGVRVTVEVVHDGGP